MYVAVRLNTTDVHNLGTIWVNCLHSKYCLSNKTVHSIPKDCSVLECHKASKKQNLQTRKGMWPLSTVLTKPFEPIQVPCHWESVHPHFHVIVKGAKHFPMYWAGENNLLLITPSLTVLALEHLYSQRHRYSADSSLWDLALPGVPQWTEWCPVNKFPVRAHVWVVGQVSSRGHTRGNHTLMFLSLCPSHPLSKNK